LPPPITIGVGFGAHTDWAVTETENFGCICYQYGGESESGLETMGSSANWRCIVLEKLNAVELLEGVWRTAPNHSRPASCVVEADVDAEDPRE
jgi:hypothetical protein